MTPSGNTILITGGGSGIGLALAQAFHGQGNTVIIAGRRAAPLEAAVAATPGLDWRSLDVAEGATIPGFATALIADYPELNVVIHNAGIMRAEDLTADPVDLRDAEAMVTTNLLGPIRLSAALLPHLHARPRATLVTVTSGLAFVPLALTPTYSATKAALHSWSQSLRHQLRDTSVEVIEMAPPMVQTDLMPGQAQDPRGLSLADFIAETMALFNTQPTPPENCVERVNFLRRAEAEGRFDQVFAMLNSPH